MSQIEASTSPPPRYVRSDLAASAGVPRANLGLNSGLDKIANQEIESLT